jgi:hypothetical protein
MFFKIRSFIWLDVSREFFSYGFFILKQGFFIYLYMLYYLYEYKVPCQFNRFFLIFFYL